MHPSTEEETRLMEDMHNVNMNNHLCLNLHDKLQLRFKLHT